jgi:hypothetical protein
MREAGVEINHRKSIAFEWLPTVHEAIERLGEAGARFGPTPIRL